VAGVLQLAKLPLPLSLSVSEILVCVESAGSGLTATENYVGIYSSSGTLLASTGDQSTVWTSTGVKTMDITGKPVSIAGGPGTFVWIAVLTNGTGPPQFQSSGAGVGALNAGLATASARAGTILATQTSLPSSITPTNIAMIVNQRRPLFQRAPQDDRTRPVHDTDRITRPGVTGQAVNPDHSRVDVI
jgi:hypothetical protein